MTVIITLLFALAGAIGGWLNSPTVLAIITLINGVLAWSTTWWRMENFFISSAVVLFVAFCTSSAHSLGLLEKKEKHVHNDDSLGPLSKRPLSYLNG